MARIDNFEYSIAYQMSETKHDILYTIGHSNYTIKYFIDLLERYKIGIVVDVRSVPYSRYCSQFGVVFKALGASDKRPDFLLTDSFRHLMQSFHTWGELL